MAYKQLFAESQRKQALADALAGQAMTPRQHPQGRIAANTGFADALGSLGQALVSRRLGKQATQLGTQAEAERAKAQAAALAGMSGRPEFGEGPPAPANPAAYAQQFLEAGGDPIVAKPYLAQHYPDTTSAGSASVQGYNLAKSQGYEGTYLDYKREFEGREANAPSSVQEWQMFNALSPEDQQRFLEMKRTVPVEKVNQVPTRILAGGVQQPLSTTESEAAAAAAVAGAEQGARTTAQSQAEAQQRLGSDVSRADQALQTIQQLREHPGRSLATGRSRMLGTQLVPGTPGYDFDVLRKQASGQVFLAAYQELKGGGHITEIEGQKAEQAIARMDAAQSDEAFLAALNDLEQVIRTGVENAKRKAGAQAASGMPDFAQMSDDELRRMIGGQ